MRKILNSLIFGLLFALTFRVVVFSVSDIYYYFSPAKSFIEVQKFELKDYKAGSAQPLEIHRKNDKSIRGDFFYKFFCENGAGQYKTKTAWSQYASKNVLLHSTGGDVAVIEVELEYPFDLPPGNCRSTTSIYVEIHGISKHLGDFENEFLVLP